MLLQQSSSKFPEVVQTYGRPSKPSKTPAYLSKLTALFKPFDPYEWLTSNLSLQYHPIFKRLSQENKGYQYQTKCMETGKENNTYI